MTPTSTTLLMNENTVCTVISGNGTTENNNNHNDKAKGKKVFFAGACREICTSKNLLNLGLFIGSSMIGATFGYTVAKISNKSSYTESMTPGEYYNNFVTSNLVGACVASVSTSAINSFLKFITSPPNNQTENES